MKSTGFFCSSFSIIPPERHRGSGQAWGRGLQTFWSLHFGKHGRPAAWLEGRCLLSPPEKWKCKSMKAWSSRNLTIWKYERAKSWSARWRASVCAPLLWKHRLEKLTRIWPEKRICHICEDRKEVKWGIRRQNGERVKTLRRSSCLIRRRYQFLREGGAGICKIQRTRSTKKTSSWDFRNKKIPFWIDYVLMIAIHAHLYDGVDDDDIEEFNNKTPSDSFSQLLRGLWQASLFDNFQHFTFLFVSIFPALIWFSLKSRIGWYLSKTFSKGCENEVELGAVVAHGKLDQACLGFTHVCVRNISKCRFH